MEDDAQLAKDEERAFALVHQAQFNFQEAGRALNDAMARWQSTVVKREGLKMASRAEAVAEEAIKRAAERPGES